MILRYLRLYGYFVRFSISKTLEFRIDFFMRIIMDVIYYTVNILFFRVLFLHTPLLAGWNEPQTLLFVAGYLVVDAVNMTFISNNMWQLPLLVNKGDLDYYLIRPVSSLFFLSLRDFAFSSFINLLMSLGILVWAACRMTPPLTAPSLFLFLGFLMIGGFIYYLIRLAFILPVFWIQAGRGLDPLFWPLTRFMERPDRIFHGPTRMILLTVVPMSLVASVPTRLIIEKFNILTLVHLLVVSVLFFGLVLLSWSYALKNYSSASS